MLHVYFLTLRLTAYVFCTIRLTGVYSLTVRLAACLVLQYQLIFSHYQVYCISTLTRRLAVIYSLTLTQARCLSILTPANSPPTYSHTIRLTAIHSHSQACCLSILSLLLRLAACLLTLSGFCLSVLTPSGLLPVYSHTSRLTAYLFSHYQTHCHLFSLHQARCLSILTLSGSLSIYSHTQVTVYLFSHPMLLRYSCSLAHQCICALSGSLPIYSCTQTSHLSSPTPGYLVPTIRFATYLALVCCLATARLTTGVLSCLSIVLVLTHPHTQTCSQSSCTSSYSICALSDSLPSNLALSDLPT